MAGINSDMYVLHANLSSINKRMGTASETLNTTVKNLMTQVTNLVNTGWDGLGAGAYTQYMVRYDDDQRRMNKSLHDMSVAVNDANKDYNTQDETAQSSMNSLRH